MTKAIIFDLYETLITHFDPDWSPPPQSIAQRLGLGKARQVYADWLTLTRPGPGPGNLRRPRWLLRPYKPAPEMYEFEETTVR